MNQKEKNYIDFFNNSKTLSKPKIINKYGDNMKSFFERIPKEELRKMPIIDSSKNYQRKYYINGINIHKKPEMNRINKDMNISEKKLLSDINNFKERFYDYNKEQEDQMGNFEKIQEENEKFSKIYKKIQIEKGKFKTGTYLDYEPFINISSRYLSKNIQIPNLSNEHSIFSGNPLILSGSELQDYISYNLGNRNKAMNFLNKVDEIVDRKKTGNTKFTQQEIDRLEKIIQQEKPKGYLPPEVLIPKLKKDIIKSKDTCKNLDNLELFFKSFDKKRKLNDFFSSFKKNINRSTNNISIKKNNNNYPTILNNIKNYNNLNSYKAKYASYKNFLNSSSATGTTGIFATRNSSIQDTSKELCPNSNISGILSGRYSTSLKYTPISSPFERKDYNNFQINEAIFTNRLNSSKIDFQKNLNLMPKTIDTSALRNISKISKKNILKSNLLKFNQLKGKKKKILKFKKSQSLVDLNKENSILNIKKDNITYGSERGEIAELINNIETKKQCKENSLNNIEYKNEENDNNDNKNPNFNDNNNLEENNEFKNEKRLIGLHKSICFNQKIPELKELDSIKYEKIENLFNQALKLVFKSNKNKSKLEEYAISRGRIPYKKINKKDTYFNILKLKEKSIENNIILEEYMIRNGTNDIKSLSKEQNNIIDINNHFINKMVNYEKKFKEMLCEETMEK